MAENTYDGEVSGELIGAPVDSVTVRLQRLINLGDYNNVTIDIAVTSGKRDSESMDEAFDRVFNFVEKKWSDKVELVEG